MDKKKETHSGERVADMNGNELGSYIRSFSEGTIDDATALVLIERVKQLKKEGKIKPDEAIAMLADIDTRMPE